MNEIERIQQKIDSCYKRIEENNLSILSYRIQKNYWNIAQLEKNNIEIVKLIQEEKENLNFEKSNWVKHYTELPKVEYKKFPRELTESQSIDMLETLNWK